MTSKTEKYYRFDKESLEEYTKLLARNGNDYLAEKTLYTIEDWVKTARTELEIEMIASHAIKNYLSYISKSGPPMPAFLTGKLMEKTYTEEVKNALLKVAKPFP
jgi:putative sterol carrier protein